MNRYEFFIYILVIIHIMVWLYVFFAWTLPYNQYHIMFILLVFLPGFYIVQSMPCHAIVYAKLMFIKNNRHHFKSCYDCEIGRYDRYIVGNIAQSCNMSEDELIDILKILKYYEHALVLPKLVENARAKFSGRSFENPLSAQGMLILTYVINVTALLLIKQNCFLGVSTSPKKLRR